MKILPLLVAVTTTIIFSTSYANSVSDTSLPKNNTLVMAGDKYITLIGQQLNVGEHAPNFKVVNESFSPVQLSDFNENIVLISTVPSLDTGVCSLQTKRFNDEVANLSKEVEILTISNDLPFAQKRFCKAEKVDQLTVLSDSVWRDFGQKYGLLIQDMGLLTRAIFIIDKTGKIAYKELVENISSHPNYEMALATLKALSTQQVSASDTDTTQDPNNN